MEKKDRQRSNELGNKKDFLDARELFNDVYFRKLYWRMVYGIFAISCIVVVLLLHFRPELFFDDKYVRKDPLINKITVLIENGAPLDIIKHAYEVRNLEVVSPFLKKNNDEYYDENVPLSSILNDIAVIYYYEDSLKEDTLFQDNLSEIIQENQYHNPFDNLEDYQIIFFENIRKQVGEDYKEIKDDVSSIASEMSNKNQLVSKYLNRSNLSFTISIVALVISFISSIIQIFMGINTNKRIDQVTQSKLENTNKED